MQIVDNAVVPTPDDEATVGRRTVITADPHPGIRLITLDDEPTRNALTSESVDLLLEAVRDAQEDDAVKALVLTGAASTFCSGGNTRGMGQTRPRPLDRKQRLWRQNQRLVRELHATDKPIIAAINGPAIGAGADLALHADIRLIGDGAYLRWSYINLGVIPGAGGAWILPKIVGSSRALELLWSGRPVEATEAVALGVAMRSVAQTRLLDTAYELAGSFVNKPLQALRLIKRMVQQSASASLEAALDAASSHFALLQETDDHAEAVAAMREKREPSFSDS